MHISVIAIATDGAVTALSVATTFTATDMHIAVLICVYVKVHVKLLSFLKLVKAI